MFSHLSCLKCCFNILNAVSLYFSSSNGCEQLSRPGKNKAVVPPPPHNKPQALQENVSYMIVTEC